MLGVNNEYLWLPMCGMTFESLGGWTVNARLLLERRRCRKEGAEAQESDTADEIESDTDVLARSSQRRGHGNSRMKDTSGDRVMHRSISTWAGRHLEETFPNKEHCHKLHRAYV